MLIAALIIFEIIVFAVLISVFRRIMTQNVVMATQHLEELNSSYSEKEKEAERQLEEARQKSEELLDNSRQEAEKIRQEIIKRAEEEREAIVKSSRQNAEEIIQQADKTRQQLLSEMESRIAQAAVAKACELIQDTLPEEFKQLVHTQWVEELISGEFGSLERLHLPQDIKEVKVISAFALTPGERKTLIKKLEDALNRSIVLQEEVDPKAVAGLVVSIGDIVLDGSLKNKIQEKARG